MSRDLDASVVILSYERVHLLERTLTACLADRSADTLAWEIIVVDNHPDKLSERLVARLAQVAPAPITYLSDARRNVSIVRNLGIAKARGRYVAFIDDDEAPEPGWLKALVSTLDCTGADAAFGPKYPEFEGGAAPAWNRDGWRYTLDMQMNQDEQIHLFGRLRRKGKGLGSGNAAFRVATCFDTPEPFAVAFGDGNGEDTHMLFRLALAGKRFVWSPNAKVLEFIERDRAKPSYMITRMKRGSQHYAASRIATSGHKLYTQARVTLLGLAQVAVHAGLFLISAEWLRRNSFNHRIGMAKGLGKLTWRAPIGFIDETAA
jgi:glycosyltransferase involved in cell wall biosynthesis